MDPAIAHAMCEAADPIAAFCADVSLWGALAGDARLVSALRTAFNRITQFTKEHQL
jgi:D-arabinitol 4-dehydrogenase